MVILSIAAKDSGAPVTSTIEGENETIVVNGPANVMDSFDIYHNSEKLQHIDKKVYPHRMFDEFKEFNRMIEKHDMSKCKKMLNHSDEVMQVLQKAVESAGIGGKHEIHILNGDRREIINLAVSIEARSNHPLAKAIAKLADEKIDHITTNTIKGKGISATLENDKYYLGNLALIEEHTFVNAKLTKVVNKLSNLGNSIVIFSNTDQSMLAVFGIKDRLRPESKAALLKLKQLGIKKLVMLSGDNQETAKQIAAELPIDEVHGQMLPADKAQFVKNEQANGHHIAFIGDGVNDSPALANADVAIAIGSGTDVAIDVADIVLVKNDLRKIDYALAISKRTVLNMNENIAIALLTVLLLFVGLFAGYVEMASGMFIHEFSILVVILNEMRLIKNS